MTCENCKSDVNSIVIHGSSLWCWPCHNETKGQAFGSSAFVHADDIPGGVLIHHGLCHDDGTPRKFYSKSDIKRAAFEKNLTQGYDTPKPNQRFLEAEAKGRK